jgi:4-amino-4-deoxy-L-arabinose transferase-like glycosyltransferase
MSLAVATPSRRAPVLAGAPAPPGAGPGWRVPGWIAPGLVVALAGLLRCAGLGAMRDNSFYDAAVRSMGGSWRAFLTGAIDPSAAVSVDKPPIDLWLQVASTRLLGFGSLGLHLPEALAGTLAVLALFDLLRVLFGREAALAGALALAVLPIAVITSRSDTMDSLMTALVIAAAALAARAARGDRPGLLVAAGAVLGLAFEVKLFEALVAAPALVLLWWAGSWLSRRRRAAALGAAGAAFAVVALAWLVALPALAGAHRPWAFGSTNGSAWNATFVYDGVDRLTGFPHLPAPVLPAAARRPPATAAQLHRRRHELAVLAHERAHALAQRPAGPSPWRLFTATDRVGARAGLPLGLALLALAAALLVRADRGLDRLARAGALALLTWLGMGIVLFSAQSALKPRYLEVVDPAIAAVLGVAVVRTCALTTRRSWRLRVRRAEQLVTMGALAAVLAAPAAVSVAAVTGRAEDAGAPGALSSARRDRLAAYALAHRHGARFDLAAISVGAAASLIAKTGQPVQVLAANDARPLVSISGLRREIARGDVRTVLLGAPCAPLSPDLRTGCSPLAVWVRAHGVDVSRAAGQAHAGSVYVFVTRGGRRGTPTSAPSTRTRGDRSRRRFRASRGRRPGCARARRRSQPCTAPSAARRRRAPATGAPSCAGSRRVAATARGSVGPHRGHPSPFRRTARRGRRCRESP